jgi:hypothetical protein
MNIIPKKISCPIISDYSAVSMVYDFGSRWTRRARPQRKAVNRKAYLSSISREPRRYQDAEAGEFPQVLDGGAAVLSNGFRMIHAHTLKDVWYCTEDQKSCLSTKVVGLRNPDRFGERSLLPPHRPGEIERSGDIRARKGRAEDADFNAKVVLRPRHPLFGLPLVVAAVTIQPFAPQPGLSWQRPRALWKPDAKALSIRRIAVHGETLPFPRQNRKGKSSPICGARAEALMKYEWFSKDSRHQYCHSNGAVIVAEIAMDENLGKWIAYDLTGPLTRKICTVKDLQEAKIAVTREFLTKANA